MKSRTREHNRSQENKGERLSTYLKVVESMADAEAEQGEGPAAASASGSAVGKDSTSTSSVSVVVGQHGAAAASNIGVVAVGPYGASAASEVGVVSVGLHGAAASSNAANSNRVAIDKGGIKRRHDGQKTDDVSNE